MAPRPSQETLIFACRSKAIAISAKAFAIAMGNKTPIVFIYLLTEKQTSIYLQTNTIKAGASAATAKGVKVRLPKVPGVRRYTFAIGNTSLRTPIV